ncbi:unnamed protein product [Prorocentrum cordatum]|uniref:PARP n=1 Tax=Prorocentrum cordatum TaxID=2364126 RepID=A0ABN9WNU2_9DINO|nr:unnamed protein product [Polarella glacialis]
MYPEYLVIYSRAYETTDEASLRALVSQPYFMQHPVYWRNAHKDPDKVFFGDQFELGRGALGILQRLVEAANSNPGVTLTVLRARRLELSDWKRYSGLRKAWKRRRPESPPGTPSEAEPGSRDSSEWQPRRCQHAHELDGHPDSWRAFAAVHGEVEAAGQVIPMPTLDRDLNECLLWHGISPKDAEWVANDGAAAMVHLAEGAPGRFGVGVYFVEDLSKVLGNAQAHDGQRVPRAYSEDMAMNLVYAKMQGGIKVVILCRVLCGDLFYTEAKSEPDAVSNMAAAGKDAVLANPERRGAREFVVTKGPQIYPEYVIELQETCRENLTAAV